MSTFLEISLILASLAIVLFVGMLIPLMLFAKKKIEHFAEANDQLRANINELIRDSRNLVGNLSKLAERADTELKEVSQVVHTVQGWANKADGMLNDVGEAVGPVVRIVRSLGRFGPILSAVGQMFSPKKLQQSS